jgi:hypothetical protein
MLAHGRAYIAEHREVRERCLPTEGLPWPRSRRDQDTLHSCDADHIFNSLPTQICAMDDTVTVTRSRFSP